MTALRPEQDVTAAADLWTIDEVIDDGSVRTLFQPVVHLASGTIAGFEALSRGPAGSNLESPLALIEAARSAGRLGELDWMCRIHAMQAAATARLPETLSWLINVEPAGLAIDCPPLLMPALGRARSDLRVVLEVVERDVQGNVLDLILATDQARRDAWGVALDDVGAEEGSLALLPLLHPDVVKLDMSLVQGVPHEAAAMITAGVRAYAEAKGAVILAEGIENQDQERLAKIFGATYGQGYYYGRPGPLPESVDVPAHPIPIRQYVEPLDGKTPFEALAATIEPQRGAKPHLLHISEHLERQAAQATYASVLLASFESAALFDEGTRIHFGQIALSTALTIVLADGLERHDGPTYHLGQARDGSGLDREWAVIVLNPQFAAAFAARDSIDQDTGRSSRSAPDRERQLDFIYTHDRDAVIRAARCFVGALGDSAAPQVSAPANHLHLVEQPVEEPGHEPAQRELAGLARLAEAITKSGSDSLLQAMELAAMAGAQAAASDSFGFRAAAQLVLDFLTEHLPMSFWSITRVENERQTYLYLGENDFGVDQGGSTPWQDTLCVHMTAGQAPQIAPDISAIPAYATAPVNRVLGIGAYAGAPIVEPDGTLFGAICGLDKKPRADLAEYAPVLTVLSQLLTLVLSTDRALRAAQHKSDATLDYLTTDALTGLHNAHAWRDAIARLDRDYTAFADPTVVLIADLDGLKAVNDGPAGRSGGDELLRTAAKVLRRSVREGDFVARIGGGRFGVILGGTPTDLAPATAARLAKALDRASVPTSVGWAALLPDGTVESAVETAERSMQLVKRGRRPR